MTARRLSCLTLQLVTLLAAFVVPASAQQRDATPVDIVEAWLASPHADRMSEAFTHWNADGAVPENCATCHSGPGLIDFLGADGSTAGLVDHPAPVGSPVDCAACHNAAAAALEAVTFPSGARISGLGASAVCTVCHQGRASTDSVTTAIGETEDDTVSSDLAFVNVHYRAAAATLFGGEVRGGYQYSGRSYVGRFQHVEPFNACSECHSPHNLKVADAPCAACHQGSQTLRDIRMSNADADGDGNASEGIAGEIATLHDRLGAAIGTYAAAVAGQPIAYAADAYPYFFVDRNSDGTAAADEAVFPNRYDSWTPRLLRAAYNYQFVSKDPGAYAHNPRYTIQLLVDSLESLAERAEIDVSGLVRP